MSLYIIQYTADPTFVLSASDQQNGSGIVLQSRSTADPQLIAWDANILTGFITLYSTMTAPVPLVLTAPNCSARTQLTVAGVESGNSNQKWNWTPGTTSFIQSQGCAGMVVDDANRHIADNNTIWLYPNNGSPAQQWTFTPLAAFDLETAVEAFA